MQNLFVVFHTVYSAHLQSPKGLEMPGAPYIPPNLVGVPPPPETRCPLVLWYRIRPLCAQQYVFVTHVSFVTDPVGG